MKKKILTILITILTACMLMFTLSACGDKTPQITGITVSGQAEVYIDEFDYADYTITATYDNGTTENVTLQAEHLSAEDNAKISTVGTHTLTVTYSGKTATLSLTVKNHDFYGVTFEDKTVTYNGLPQTIEVLGLPSGANVTYSPNNTYTEVGEYPVTATITKQYYNDMQLTATLKIEKATYDMSGVIFADKTVTYDSSTQYIYATNLPNGVTVKYENNGKTDVGTYTVVAKFTGNANYNDIPDMTATLKITDIIRKITFVQAGVEDIVKEVVDGGTLSKNEIPTPQEVNGYEVTWNRTDFTNITSNVTVEIVKSLKTYTITYILNGGTNYINNPKEFTIESPTLTLYTPSKEIGATFAGWYTNSAFTDESKITEIKHGSYGNKTIYAKWLDYRIENADGFAIDYKQQPALVSMTVPYTTENIDLNSRFMVSKGCTWKLYSDFMGNYEFPLKAMTLSVGENKAYIIVFHPDGEHFTRYLLNIYRLDMKEYAFMNGLSVWKDGEIQERSELSAPTTNPEKTGYTFGGWAVDGNKVEFPYTVTKDVMFTAIFIPIEYDIVYYLNNGELNTNKTKYTIEQYFTFDTPTRDYYEFSGWFNNANFDGNAITGISIGTYGKINLYAKWTPVDYVIDYEENGGTNDENNPTEYNVETATITLKNPTKDGFTFNGWYKESTFNTKVTQIVKGSHGNIKLYAKWTENVNGLNFDGNGNTSGSMTAIALKTGETKAIPLNTFVKTGYTFRGWSTSTNGSVVYNDGSNYTMGTNSQYTLYAVWEANLNTLTFNGNGANGGSTSSMQIRTDANKALNANGFTRTKYLFAGWAESANGAVKYTDGATYTMGTNASYTLYAVWTLNENEITFNGNGNTSGSMPNQTVYNNGNKVLNNNAFVKNGYHFIGWAESKDGEVKYTDGATVTFVQKENYTLYAKWEANLNTLTFNGNGNTGGSTNSMQIRSDATATLNQNGFTKTGYTFKGWSTSKNGEVEYLNGASYTMGLNSSYTIYAVWEENVNGLNFDGNGNTSGTMNAVALKTGETKAIPSNTFVKTGYHFIGWAESKDGAVVYNDGANYIMGTNSQYTLYAVWEANLNTLTFNGNGATGGATSSMQIRSDATAILNLNGFTRTGYVFDGWSTTENGAVEFEDGDAYTMGTDSKYTLYAVWVLNENIIVFNGNGATSGTMDNQTVYADGNRVLNNNLFERTGYTFVGWSYSENGEVDYADNATFSMGMQEQYTLYAVWEINVYTITYVLNGGTNHADNIETFTVLDLPFALNNAEQTGMHFYGFFKESSFENEITELSELENITLYARFVESTDGIVYSLSDNEDYAIVTGYTGTETKVFIAEYYQGVPVTSIGNSAFYKCTSLTSIEIPNSVTSIGSGAFSFCSSLTNIEIPVNVTSIGNYAFSGCHSLSYNIKDGLIYLGNATNNYLCLMGRISYDVISINVDNDCRFILAGAFSDYNGSNIESITIGENIISIGPEAFENCGELKILNFNAVNCADFNVNNLVFSEMGRSNGGTIVVFGNKVKRIPANIFFTYSGTHFSLYKPEIISLSIGNNVEYIGEYALYGCDLITSIEIPNSVTSIGDNAFYGCSSLTSVTIGNSVASIGVDAFDSCTSLTSVNYLGTIDNWVQIEFGNVDSNPTFYAKNLYINDVLQTEITINAEKINESSFYSCDSLTSVVIGNSVTSIGDYAFSGCSSLTSVVIGDSVTSIGKKAFEWCNRLVEVINKSTHITITKGSSNNGYVGYYAAIVFNSAHTYVNKFTNDNGYIICDDGTDKILCGYDGALIELILPNYITAIRPYAFYGCDNLTSVTIGNSVTSIGSYAFYGCSSLTSVEIPDSVTSIGSCAFYNCSSLCTINIPTFVTVIGQNSFSNCSSLKEIQYNAINATVEKSGSSSSGAFFNAGSEEGIKLFIGENVECVPSYLFYSNIYGYYINIGEVFIKNTFGIVIQKSAFYTKVSIKHIYYYGSETDWTKVIIEESNSYFTNAEVYYNYNGQNHTYKFNTNGGQKVADITSNLAITLPTPTKENWYFGGWYDNAEFIGLPYTTTYYSSINTTLYAKWITEEEYVDWCDGSSFERAINVTCGESITANIDTKGEKIYYKFIPTESKSYTIKSSGGLDTYGYLYDSNGSQLTYHDGSTDFTITRSLTAGETYYIVVKMYSSSATGTFTMSIT